MGRTGKHILYFITAAYMLCVALQVQAQKFTAEVNKTTIRENEPFTVEWKFTEGSVYDFSLPDNIRDFYKVSGPFESSVTQIINGKKSGYVSLSVILKPKTKGTFTIHPARIVLKNKTIQSNSVTIKVVKEEMQSNTFADRKFFMLVTSDKTHIVSGEPVTVFYKLCVAENGTANFLLTKNPDYPNFWVKNLPDEIDKNLENTEVINGVRYGTAVVKKMILYPQKKGTYKLPPAEGRLTLEKPFDAYMYGNNTSVHDLVSNIITLYVDDLPEKGKPADFNGLVGDLQITASADKTTSSMNDAIIYKISVRGEGNLMQFTAPKLNLTDGLDAYEPKTTDAANEKIFEYTILPQQEGKFIIPAQKITYYNVVKSRYLTISTNEIMVNVSGEKRNIAGKNTSESFALDDKGSRSPAWAHGVLWAGGIMLIAVLSALLILRRKKTIVAENMNDNAEDLRYRKMKVSEAMIQLKRETEPEIFHTRLLGYIYDFISQKTGLLTSEINKESIHKKLDEKGLPAYLILQLLQLLEEMEMINYAGILQQDNKEDLLQKTQTLLQGMDEKLPLSSAD